MNDPQGFRFQAMPRSPFSAEVVLRFETLGEELKGRVVDIGREGMFIELGSEVAGGSAVNFEFFSPEGVRVSGLADVVWRRDRDVGPGRPRGIGLQFRYLDSDTQAQVDQIVERCRDSQSADTGSQPPAGVAKPAANILSPFDDLDELSPTPPASDSEKLERLLAASSSPGAPGAGSPPITETTETFVRHLKDPWASLDQGQQPQPDLVEPLEHHPHARTGVPWLLILVGVVLIGAIWGWWWWTQRDRSGSPAQTAANAAPSEAPGSADAAGGEGVEPTTSSEGGTGLGEGSASTPGLAASAGAGDLSARPGPVSGSEQGLSRLALRVVSSSAQGTVLEISGNAPIAQDAISTLRLGDPERFVVKVRGPNAEVPSVAATQQLRRVRSAVHQENGVSAVHIVLDLASSSVSASTELQNGRVLVRLVESG